MGGLSRLPMRTPGSLGEARAIQEAVAREAAAAPAPRISLDAVRHVAGADASYSPDGRTAHAAVAVFRFPDLDLLERSTFSCEVTFPYLSGYFAFREGPALIGAVLALGQRPDLLFVDGHGTAHPRRAGIAVHVGLLLGIPSVGVAKRPLGGGMLLPGPARGSAAPVMNRGEVVGMAVRTRTGSRPVVVSPGYATDLETAVAAVLATTAGSRIPAPLREAHQISREVLSKALSRPART